MSDAVASTEASVDADTGRWPTGTAGVLVAAVLGSFAFGILMSLSMGRVLLVAIPAMYGLEGLSPVGRVLVGWAIHLSHGTVLGLAFGGAMTWTVAPGTDVRRWLLGGLAYGALLWVALASFLMPLWVGAVAPMAPPVPDFRPWSLVGHLLYGAFLGVLVPVYRRHE